MTDFDALFEKLNLHAAERDAQWQQRMAQRDVWWLKRMDEDNEKWQKRMDNFQTRTEDAIRGVASAASAVAAADQATSPCTAQRVKTQLASTDSATTGSIVRVARAARCQCKGTCGDSGCRRNLDSRGNLDSKDHADADYVICGSSPETTGHAQTPPILI